MKNFLFVAPPWLSNLLSIILAVLIAVSTIGNDIIGLFTDLNCEQCVKIVQKVLSVVAVVLALIKAFSKYSTNTEEKALSNSDVVTMMSISAGFAVYQALISQFYGASPEYFV